jgi:hypothetical protein
MPSHPELGLYNQSKEESQLAGNKLESLLNFNKIKNILRSPKVNQQKVRDTKTNLEGSSVLIAICSKISRPLKT